MRCQLNWILILVIICNSFVDAVEINVFSISSTEVQISTDCINAAVDTQKDSVSIRLYTKKHIIGKFSLEKESLDSIYQKAFNDEDRTEAFFGPTKEILLVEIESGKSFKVSVEDSGKRFQIAPMAKLGENKYVPTRFPYISNFHLILEFLQGLKLWQPIKENPHSLPDK
jgi:hypothetical protein